MSAWSNSNYITESVVSYFVYGTFDINDLVAISVGCLVAVCIVEVKSRSGGAL